MILIDGIIDRMMAEKSMQRMLDTMLGQDAWLVKLFRLLGINL